MNKKKRSALYKSGKPIDEITSKYAKVLGDQISENEVVKADIQALQKKVALLEEENLILKKPWPQSKK